MLFHRVFVDAHAGCRKCQDARNDHAWWLVRVYLDDVEFAAPTLWHRGGWRAFGNVRRFRDEAEARAHAAANGLEVLDENNDAAADNADNNNDDDR